MHIKKIFLVIIETILYYEFYIELLNTMQE